MEDDAFVVIAYSAVCPVFLGVVDTVTAPTVMVLCVGVALCAGCVTVAPSPLATALAVTKLFTVTAAPAPVTLAAATVEDTVIVGALALYVVGVPDILMVTVVLFVRDAVPAVNPAGNPETVKLAAVIEDAYCALLNVKTIVAPLTACPTFKLPKPVAVASMVGVNAVLIAALCRAVPAL